MAKWIRIETYQGEPLQVQDMKLTPVSRVLRLVLPWMNFGLVWNRPSAVRVEAPGQVERTIQIEDRTRIAQVAIVGALFSAIMVFWILAQVRR